MSINYKIFLQRYFFKMAYNGRVFLLWRQLKQKLQRITNLNIMNNSETKNIQSHSGNTVLPAVVFYLDNFTDVKFIGYNENFVHKFLEMDDQCSEEQLELLQFGGKVIDEDGEHTSGTYYLSMSKVESFSFYNGC